MMDSTLGNTLFIVSPFINGKLYEQLFEKPLSIDTNHFVNDHPSSDGTHFPNEKIPTCLKLANYLANTTHINERVCRPWRG